MNHARSRSGTVAGLVFLASLTAGCGKELPPAADPDQAREALTAALDAWKEGRPLDSLRQRTPPVDFADPQRDKGARLVGYQVKNGERSGVSMKFTVALQLQQKDGTRRDRVAAYTVDAGQSVVIRPDF